VDEDGHQVQLHLHNRHTDDCLAQMLIQLMEQYAPGVLAPIGNESTGKSIQYDA
jgi:hypothetical protein